MGSIKDATVGFASGYMGVWLTTSEVISGHRLIELPPPDDKMCEAVMRVFRKSVLETTEIGSVHKAIAERLLRVDHSDLAAEQVGRLSQLLRSYGHGAGDRRLEEAVCPPSHVNFTLPSET